MSYLCPHCGEYVVFSHVCHLAPDAKHGQDAQAAKEGKLSAREFRQTLPTAPLDYNSSPADYWLQFAEAYVDYCSKADAEKIACQEKALKIAIEATVGMREKIERLEATSKEGETVKKRFLWVIEELSRGNWQPVDGRVYLTKRNAIWYKWIG